MENFSDFTAVSKFQSLTNTQNSIESISEWIIKCKENAKEVTKIWYKEFKRAPEKRKLAFIYLANHVIQNGRRSAPQFLNIFKAVLPVVFKETARINNSSTREALVRLINIWAERKIYSSDFTNSIIEVINRVWQKEAQQSNKPLEDSLQMSTSLTTRTSSSIGIASAGKRPRLSSTPSFDGTVVDDARKLSKHSEVLDTSKAAKDCGEALLGGSSNASSVAASATAADLLLLKDKPANQSVQVKELLNTLQGLENPASVDATTRRMIAEFPTELTKTEEVQKITKKEDCTKMLEVIDNAIKVVNEYNERLSQEQSQRRSLSLQLKSFLLHQNDILSGTQAKIDDYKQKWKKVMTFNKRLREHLKNLPDLRILAEKTAKLDPLPSASELFR